MIRVSRRFSSGANAGAGSLVETTARGRGKYQIRGS
jgi:hypothetical protein